MKLARWQRMMFLLAICLGVAVLLAGSAGAVEVTPAAGPAVVTGQAIEKSLAVGESVILDFQGLTRAAISDPAVADVVVLTTAQLLVNGKAQGSTTLYIWDKRGRWTYLLSVTKAPSRVAKLLPRINAEIGLPGVTATEVGGVLVLEGTVTSAAQSARAEAIASIYSKEVKNLIQVEAEAAAQPTPRISAQEVQKILGPSYKVSEIAPGTYSVDGAVLPADARRVKEEVFPAIEKLGVNIVSLLSIEAPRVRQLLVRAKIVDIDKSAVGDLGLDWGHNRLTTTTTSSVNPDTGQVSTSTGSQTTFVPNEMLFGESLLGPREHRLLDGGPILRLERFGARLQALVTQNRARILSEPNLLVKEGENASILVGGEIPIPVAQPAGATTPAVTVDWKKFGVELTVEGRVLEDGQSIDLVVMPSVSSLDFGNAITVSGITLPAMRKRSAETRVQIKHGQTLVIGGLFSSEDSKQLRKVPFLGDIPILGEFFKSRHNVRRESELMIFVTPEIVKQASSGGA